MPESDNSIIIIGAGFAGLAAGIYAQMNGYNTRVFEMHYKPGGLCTSWIRKGYTFDGCIHWLTGSSPQSGLHDIWEETGIAANRKIIDPDEYMRFEDNSGRTLIFYTNINRLEKHLLEFSPSDRQPIKEFTDGIRMCLPFDMPSKKDNPGKKLATKTRSFLNFLLKGRQMQRWMSITCENFSTRFKDPLLRQALREMWLPDFSMFFVLFTFAYMHNRNAGYPLGGSLPMSEALAARYRELGGKIFYNSKVDKILTPGNTADGIRLSNGTSYKASRIISAADGYSTIYRMLEGRYENDSVREIYGKWQLFPPLIYVGIGVNRTFNDEPKTVSGISFQLKKPVIIGEKIRNTLSVHIYNQDPSLAPEGKTSIIVMMETDYAYWKELSADRAAYTGKKEEIAKTVVDLLGQRYPGIQDLVEVTDVATPLTLERYTGNWKGSFEGWLLTPENSMVLLKPMSQTLPGLKNFYMCGQWVEPGGGLPTSVMSARRLVKKICREDNIRFRR